MVAVQYFWIHQDGGMKRRPYSQQMHTGSSLIRAFRLRAGMTQDELGEKIGASGQYIQKMETGRTEDLKMKWLIPIAEVFGVSVADLIPNAYGPEGRTIVFECPENWSEELRENTTNLLERLEATPEQSASEILSALGTLLRLTDKTDSSSDQSKRSA